MPLYPVYPGTAELQARFKPITAFLREKELMGLATRTLIGNLHYDCGKAKAWYEVITTWQYYHRIFCPVLAHLHCKNNLPLKPYSSVSYWRGYSIYNVGIHFTSTHIPAVGDEESVFQCLRDARSINNHVAWRRNG